jgi:hypothetical protein
LQYSDEIEGLFRDQLKDRTGQLRRQPRQCAEQDATYTQQQCDTKTDFTKTQREACDQQAKRPAAEKEQRILPVELWDATSHAQGLWQQRRQEHPGDGGHDPRHGQREPPDLVGVTAQPGVVRGPAQQRERIRVRFQIGVDIPQVVAQRERLEERPVQ